MYNSGNQQYIFKQSSGKVWNFYYDERLGLCYSLLTGRNTWTEPVSLHKNLHPRFFADMDSDDTFYLLFQDRQGNIFLSKMSSDTIKTNSVLNSRSASSYDKHLCLIPFKSGTNFFFIIQHNNNLLLAHQVLGSDGAGMPKVIDYINGSNCPYAIVYDKSDNIYAFYPCSDGKYLQLGYKKYTSTQKFWGEFTPVTRYTGNCEFPKAILDEKSIIHICYQRQSGRQYELIYQQKIPDKNIWSHEMVIHSSAHPFYDASIVFANGNLIVYWVRDDIIYHSLSSNGGSTWGRPSRYNFVSSRQLMCMSYKTNIPYENEKIIAPHLPGSFINGFKLAFLQDGSSTPAAISADELKIMLADGLKLLKASVDELKESGADMRKDILGVTSVQQDFQKELIQCTMKLNALENELRQIKSLSSQIESCRSTLSQLEARLDTLTPVPEEED